VTTMVVNSALGSLTGRRTTQGLKPRMSSNAMAWLRTQLISVVPELDLMSDAG
jgi:hypothetical protein